MLGILERDSRSEVEICHNVIGNSGCYRCSKGPTSQRKTPKLVRPCAMLSPVPFYHRYSTMKAILAAALLLAGVSLACQAGDLDTMGVTRLRGNDATLTGTGISVAQAEAQGSANDWEVDPPNAGQARQPFHLDQHQRQLDQLSQLAGHCLLPCRRGRQLLLRRHGGSRPRILHVDNYEADYFYSVMVAGGLAMTDKVVNQSFIFTALRRRQTVDLTYDAYMANNGILFCSAVGNSGPPVRARARPTTASALAATALDANSSIGPTAGQWAIQTRSGGAGIRNQLFHSLRCRRRRRSPPIRRPRRWRHEHCRRRGHAHGQSPPPRTGRLNPAIGPTPPTRRWTPVTARASSTSFIPGSN